MTDDQSNPKGPVSEEMSQYLQIFVDETEEQLEELVEVLLVLEREPESADELNESFRLIHSIKGSAGMMGIDNIAVLTHHLENRFEAFRSRSQTLDEPTMNLVLRCIDFLRDCVRRLRAGTALGSAADLLRELTDWDRDETKGVATPTAEAASPEPEPEPIPDPPPVLHHEDALRVAVVFEPGLPLADLKARLIVSRLSALGEIVSTTPDAAALDAAERLERFEAVIVTDETHDTIRDAVDLDGVQGIELDGAGVTQAGETPVAEPPPVEVTEAAPAAETRPEAQPEPDPEPQPEAEAPPDPEPEPEPRPEPTPATPDAERGKPRVAETMRVDIDRLDRLMNLAGELVVNRARFVQVTSEVGPSFRTRNVVGRVRDFGETLRGTIDQLRSSAVNGEWASRIEELETGLRFLEEQSELWDDGRKCFTQIGEAIDQLTRISDNLQQSVLGTRMVPVAPLFNRFNRVVRDLSSERGKKVELRIQGEKTELDKRMIDKLGDPLVHLVRNSIDHGLESPAVRRDRGKPEAGTVSLEASHSGNSIYISIRDDGGGIDVERVRAKIVERQLLSSAAAAVLDDDEVLEYIWHAGLSTAREVTDVSGRGVGMDVVRTRIAELNGTVDVDSTPEVGTTFTIRLPLTLAIINSLLIRIRNIIFSMPIDDVREIVSIPAADIVDLRGKLTIDVRGEFIPLIGIDDVFEWHDLDADGHAKPASSAPDTVAAVILQANDRTVALRVDELLGSMEIVIKSLSENFVHIRGLSGASILGDGTVCLMLDVGTLIDMAIRGARSAGSAEGTRA